MTGSIPTEEKVDAISLKGDNVEGCWSDFNLVLSDVAPENIPTNSYLLDHVITQLRKSQRFAQTMHLWDFIVPQERKTYEEIRHMIADFIKRDHERETSRQFRSLIISAHNHAAHVPAVIKNTAQKKSGTCDTWKKYWVLS